MAKEVPIEFGVNCPAVEQLQAGDLLFPRPLEPHAGAEPLLASVRALRAADGSRKVGDVLADFVPALQAGPVPYSPRVVSPDGLLRLFGPVGTKGIFDPDNPTHLLLLVRILQATFPEITKDWLNMTVDEFLDHPLSEILLGAIRHDLGGGFFVGHCGLVLLEQGRPFVIEANTTDFSHYRVAIHPYFEPAEVGSGTPVAARRGWLNSRTGKGDSVWLARHRVLAGPGAEPVRAAIAGEAKTLLGRPYGFFDSPTLGDTDRLYCSEFVYQAFARASAAAGVPLEVSDCRSWAWLLENLPAGDFRTRVRDAVLKDPDLKKYVLEQKKVFFLLTVHMLWRSAHLADRFKPKGEEYA